MKQKKILSQEEKSKRSALRRARRKARKQREKENKDALDKAKRYLQFSFCGLGGEWSIEELVLMAAIRLDYTVDATIDPVVHLFKLVEIAKEKYDRRVGKFRTSNDFFDSRLWKILRYQAFEKHGNKCQCCGATPPDVVLHVDHIYPKSTHPQLALNIHNLQILCEDCNAGKLNQWDTSWIGKD